MKQIRFIVHDDGHEDEETLINGVWAVTRCDCKLTNAALLDDVQTGAEMTPNRPIEVRQASRACGEACLRRDAMIDAGDKIGTLAMNMACEILDEMYRTKYQQWQIMGGTSDIETIAFPKTETNLPAYYPLGVYHCFLCGEKMDHGGTCESCKVKIRNSNVKLQPYKTGNTTYSTEPSRDAFEEDTQIW